MEKIMIVKQALKIQADGNPVILNELMYSSYSHNRDNGMTHAQAVSIGLGNTDSLLRYVAEQKTKNN